VKVREASPPLKRLFSLGREKVEGELKRGEDEARSLSRNNPRGWRS